MDTQEHKTQKVDKVQKRSIALTPEQKSQFFNANGGFKKGHKLRIGIKLSPEERKKLSLAHKGQVPWCKGKKLSVEHRKNLSISHTGYKQTDETRRKKGEKISGSRSHFWRGGVTEKNHIIRGSIEYKLPTLMR